MVRNEKDTLVCTNCDSIVSLSLSYDGYSGACSCRSHNMSVGSGDRPRSWSRLDDVKKLDNLTFYREGEVRRGEVLDETTIVCNVCKDDEHTSATVSEVNVAGYRRKVTARCDADHYRDDRAVESVAYMNEYRAEPITDSISKTRE